MMYAPFSGCIRAAGALSMVLILVLAGPAAPHVRAQEGLDPKAMAVSTNFMKMVFAIQAIQTKEELEAIKQYLQKDAQEKAYLLDCCKSEVEAARAKIKDSQKAIDDLTFQMVGTMDLQAADAYSQQLKEMRRNHRALVRQEKETYRKYARFRGSCLIINICYNLFIKEIDKRIASMGKGASGTWAGTYTDDSGGQYPQSGPFWLGVESESGVITGWYVYEGKQFPVKGKWERASGACSGAASGEKASATFSGNLKASDGGYSGNGVFTYTEKGGSCAGKWSTP